MTVPEYLVTFRAAIRPLVAAIALGLIWIAPHAHGRTRTVTLRNRGCPVGGSRCGLAVAQYFGLGNAYFAQRNSAIRAASAQKDPPEASKKFNLRSR